MKIRVSPQGFWVGNPSYNGRLLPWNLIILSSILVPLLISLFIVYCFKYPQFRINKDTLKENAYDRSFTFLSLSQRIAEVHLVNAFFKSPVRSQSPLPDLHIEIGQNKLKDLYKDSIWKRLDFKKKYYNILYKDEQGLAQAKLTYRGLGVWHYGEEKPSFRIKIKKEDIQRGQRYIELTRPEDSLGMFNWLPCRLAPKVGLIADRVDYVRLFINNRYYGVYHRGYRPGEPLALHSNRLPGTFFKGDVFSSDTKLWHSLSYWKVFGEENSEATKVMNRFFKTLMEPSSPQQRERFGELVNEDLFARNQALMTLLGGVHTDHYHNHLYYYCPNQGQIEPLVWDSNALGMMASAELSLDPNLHLVTHHLSRDPRWVHQKNRYLYQWIQNFASQDSLHQIIDQKFNEIAPDLRADTNLSKLARQKDFFDLLPISVLEIEKEKDLIKNWITQRIQFVSKALEDAQVYVTAHHENSKHSIITVFGQVAVMVATPAGQQLLYPGLSKGTYKEPQHLEAGGVWEVPISAPAPLVYELPFEKHQLTFYNALSQKKITPQSQPPRFLPPNGSLHPEAFPAPAPAQNIVFESGIHEIHENLILRPQDTLTIEAGATLKLAAGVGIYCRGQVQIKGNAQNPVSIQPQREDQPFACFALEGPGTNKSVIENLHISGGQSGSDGIRHFKGMLNIYRCPEITLRSCHIGQNFLSDDALNIAESTFLVENCFFTNALSDAFDADMCQGIVRHCHFKNSGNDALDFMNSQVRVDNCSFETSGDKGISIGEKSLIWVKNSSISNCTIGIENKDDSLAIVENCQFLNNLTAWHAYQKKWIYARGGSGCLIKCEFEDNYKDIVLEKKSQLDFIGNKNHLNSVEGDKRLTFYSNTPDKWTHKLKLFK